MANKEPNKSNNLTVFRKIYSAIDKDNYYGYLPVEHYRPSIPTYRVQASKAFTYWFLKNYPSINFGNDDIKKYIVDSSNDQGIDAVVATSSNWQVKGCEDIYFFQAKFYEVPVDIDAIKQMEMLYHSLLKGRYGFSGDIYNKLNSLNIFNYLNNYGVKVHLILFTTTYLEDEASKEWQKFNNEIRYGSLNVNLLLYDDEYFRKIL